MRHLPPLAAVRAFEAAARHGHFTRASEELGMTQAAVSYQVRLLEERIGHKLFFRTGGGVKLTNVGARIAPLLSGAFDTMEEAFRAVRQETESVLTISCTVSFASNWLAPRLGAFQVTRPSLAVRLQSQNHLVDFAREDVDVAVRVGLGEWPGLASHFIMRDALRAYASPAFLAAHPPIRSVDDVLRLPRISAGDEWWSIWRSRFDAAHIDDRPAPGLRLDSQVMEVQAVMAGHGIGLLNPLFWAQDIAAGRLVPAFGKAVFDPRSYWLVHPAHTAARPKVKAFREWLLAEAAREAASDPFGNYERPVAHA
ncbi:LysR substrate-binding domain-containing protein [Sphingosinicella microcystinivorans]|uniref:LysR substrate-binding domain-containing protein n=1 Tax=Sphingosinicella microcystinivorans TaxID=335406 RepID=UPI0022F3CF25|nr:LysR substrate-binding domain-containing protein [Sphingosinicella microcystinivorans]WBX83606.1 LysR substrate-binding domain-containing protein [Sphingosinicella microcystinivorans]